MIELLAPAGSRDALDAAIGEGADAVYMGLKEFNARNRAHNFSFKEIEAATYKLHSLKKKLYITLNVVFEEWESNKLFSILQFLDSVTPDGIIVQDLGLIKLIHENFPKLKIHASTQMNIASSNAVNHLSRYGVNRVVLARELSLNQIQNIRQQTNSELEIFVHGALCISASGLCMFSSYLGGKSANRGSCTQACRRLYYSEGEKGFFFSPNDLQLIEMIPDIVQTGIESLKIEGRMKSSEYVANVVKGYRFLLDNMESDRENAIAKSLSILSQDFARAKTDYYFTNKLNLDFLKPDSAKGTGIYLGKVKEVTTIGGFRMGRVEYKYKLFVNDSVRIHSSNDVKVEKNSYKIKKIINQNGNTYINLPDTFNEKDDIFLINKSSLKHKFEKIIPTNLSAYKKYPGKRPAPNIKRDKFPHTKQKLFEGGYYVKVNTIKDVFLTQTMRPKKIIIPLERGASFDLKRQIGSLPYNSNDIIISLEPFFVEDDLNWFMEEIDFFIEAGYKHYIVNNLAHINILKNKNLNLIAGPYLYTFNKYAIDFLLEQGIDFLISPIENNKKNMINSTKFFNKNRFFVTVFAYPELFIIPSDLSRKYSFGTFWDKFDNTFFLHNNKEKSIVINDKPFSIVDRINYLKREGFFKFVIDFSHTNLTKKFYRNIIKSCDENSPIPKSSRFNWKEGFFNGKI